MSSSGRRGGTSSTWSCPDCPNPARLGGLLDGARGPGARVLNIDHHADNRRYGDVNWIDTRAAATGEMVYDLIEAAGPAAHAPTSR